MAEVNQNMNIGMVLESSFPPDIRIEKEAKSLIQNKFNVFVISAMKKGLPSKESSNGIEIIRISYPKNVLSRIAITVLFHAIFVNFLWKKELVKIIKEYNIHILHVHDLPLVKTSVLAAKKYGIPVVADLHENYPEQLKWSRKMSFHKKIFTILAPVWRWKRLERIILKKVKKIIAVVAEAKEHYVKDCHIHPDKILVVMNVVDLQQFKKAKINHFKQYEKNFVLSYVGGFGPHRGIDTVIGAMPYIIKKIPHAKLLLVGGTPSPYEESLKQLCQRIGAEKYVAFTRWVDFEYIPSYIAASDVCLVPHHANEHTNTTIPHKLFQYMALGKPVIATNCSPIERIVKETQCGIIVPSGDHDKMTDAVIKLYSDHLLAKKLGENGKKAVEKKYNWEREVEALIGLYNKMEEMNR